MKKKASKQIYSHKTESEAKKLSLEFFDRAEKADSSGL